MLSHVVGLSGGLRYHYKALRQRPSGLWTSFRERVRTFLETEWNPRESELILVGPSAGWTLPFEWLAHFERIHVVEPDPLARALLRLRLKNVTFDSSTTRLPWFESSARGTGLRELLARRPDSALLFANVLGQIPLLVKLDAKDEAAARDAFRRALEGRNWASFHDVLSSHLPFRKSIAPAQTNDLESLALTYFGERAEVVDHGTEWLAARSFGEWTLARKQYHLIGFTWPKAP